MTISRPVQTPPAPFIAKADKTDDYMHTKFEDRSKIKISWIDIGFSVFMVSRLVVD